MIQAFERELPRKPNVPGNAYEDIGYLDYSIQYCSKYISDAMDELYNIDNILSYPHLESFTLSMPIWEDRESKVSIPVVKEQIQPFIDAYYEFIEKNIIKAHLELNKCMAAKQIFLTK